MMTKPVLFVSFRPLERAENLRAIYEAYDGEKEHILSSDPYYRDEVTSGKYDVMVTDDFPSVTPGKCIVIWHGIQGGKTIGFNQPGHPYFSEKTSRMITYVISASTGMVNTWSRCTGVPPTRILPLGMPRTDEYIHYKHEHSDKKTYLYVPTFRDKNDPPFPSIAWAYLDDQLTDDEVLLVKAHPWQDDTGIDQVTQHIGNGMYKHIVVLSPAGATTPFLYLADVVITDYSSIMFDAYLLNKPVVLFEKEHSYASTRGMYLDYPYDYSSFIALSEYELLEYIRYRAKHPFLTEKEKSCRQIVADRCDGHACERLTQLIHDINK